MTRCGRWSASGSSASASTRCGATRPSTSGSRRPTRSSWSTTKRSSPRSLTAARLRRGQTPQGFRLSTIRRAYELAWQDPDFAATDDCSVVLKYLPDVPIHIVEGSEHNMKVTAPVDLFIADKLFQLGSSSVEPLAQCGGVRRAAAWPGGRHLRR